jgi:hypothetical protein
MPNMRWGFTDRPATREDVKACVGPGWGKLLDDLMDDLDKLGWNGSVMQVKEKFGGLRFYIGSATDEVFERVAKAEQDSYHICEQCGKDGTLRRKGWWRTLCEECQTGVERN